MGTYTSEWPATAQVDPKYRQFFEDFYKISDIPNADEQYVSQFTKDATFIMGTSKATGSNDLLVMRKGMWDKVASRAHNPIRIFPFGQGSTEFMLYGEVAFGLKDGRKANVEWAARAVTSTAEGPVKMSLYQVYLDSAAVQNAK